MTRQIAMLLEALETTGWNIRRTAAPLPPEIFARYHWLPADLLSFLEQLARAVNPTDTAWFLTATAIAATDEFRWNEWEIMSLDAAEGDVDWIHEIRTFWNHHFPFLLSVKHGYAYFAVKDLPGYPVIYGREPEFEEAHIVADSFSE